MTVWYEECAAGDEASGFAEGDRVVLTVVDNGPNMTVATVDHWIKRGVKCHVGVMWIDQHLTPHERVYPAKWLAKVE